MPDGFDAPDLPEDEDTPDLEAWLATHDVLPTGPPSPTVLGQWREQLANRNAICHATQLRSRLQDLQQTNAPPRRRDPWELYAEGLYEFRPGPRSSLDSLSSSSSPPDTPISGKDSASVGTIMTDFSKTASPIVSHCDYDCDRWLQHPRPIKRAMPESIRLTTEVFDFQVKSLKRHALPSLHHSQDLSVSSLDWNQCPVTPPEESLPKRRRTMTPEPQPQPRTAINTVRSKRQASPLNSNMTASPPAVADWGFIVDGGRPYGFNALII